MDETESLSITMRGEMFEEPEDPRCFMLVDEQTVGVVGDTAMQGLLSGQQDPLNDVDTRGKGVRVVHVGSERDDGILEEDKDLGGMFGVKEDKRGETETVKVVQVECGKTLEVMHIDSGKPLQVIHIEGGGKEDFLGRDTEDSVKAVISSSNPSTSLRPNKEQLSNQNTHTPTRRITTTSQVRSRIAPTLPSIRQPVTQPTMATTGKNKLRHDIDSNIIISGSKKVLGGTDDTLNNTIIISWPTMTSQGNNNTVATQTEPFEDAGPGLNLFFCTFHSDGSVETYCNFPGHDKSVSLESNRSPCANKIKVKKCHSKDEDGLFRSLEEEDGESEEMQQAGKDKKERFSRSGRILKGKGPLFKVDSGLSDEDAKADPDPDFEMQEEDEDMEKAVLQSKPLRRKRGRKRKKPPLSPDNFEDLELELEKSVKKEVEVFDEPVAREEVQDGSKVVPEIPLKKGYSLRTKRRLKKLSDMHYLQEQIAKRQPEHNRLFQCRVCEKPFPTFFRLHRHAKEEHEFTNFTFPCDECGMVFTRPQNLGRHKETKHVTGEKRFACDQCDRRFARQDVLSKHVSVVHLRQGTRQRGSPPQGAHHCSSCDSYFSREHGLQNHRKGDFVCVQCGIRHECRTALRAHVYKAHPTTCTLCGKVCNNRQQMYFHRMSHSPKYTCKFCNKGFLWKSHYTIHMSTHTGDKPVSCDICGKSFAHKVAVGKHKWQEHNANNKKFKCDQCGKCFVYRGKLESHVRSHTGEKPFNCEVCNSSFSQRSNLKAHIKSVHGVMVKSVSSDGSTHTEIVKYKRPKRTPPNPSVPPPSHPSTEVESNVIPQGIELPPPAPQPAHIDIQEQIHMSESSLETEAAVYQIVYAYP